VTLTKSTKKKKKAPDRGKKGRSVKKKCSAENGGMKSQAPHKIDYKKRLSRRKKRDEMRGRKRKRRGNFATKKKEEKALWSGWGESRGYFLGE